MGHIPRERGVALQRLLVATTGWVVMVAVRHSGGIVDLPANLDGSVWIVQRSTDATCSGLILLSEWNSVEFDI